MLTLSRKVGESLRIGHDVRVVVRAVRGHQVQIGIEAPAEVGIYREEIYEAVRRANLAAATNQTAGPEGSRRRAPSKDGEPGGVVMTIQTTRFGEIEVAPENIVEFPEGLLGLHRFQRYVMIQRNNSPLSWMQSMDLPELAFLVADPQVFLSDYSAQVGAAELATLGNPDPAKLVVKVICTVPEDPKDATVNLRAPLIIDPETRKGKQVVLTEDSPYSIHHPWAAEAAAA
jgi:flagellar assembly factor FliW